MGDRGSASTPRPVAAAGRTGERNWADLPRDVLLLIFQKIRSVEILLGAEAVCRSWRQVALEPQIWRRIDMIFCTKKYKEHEMLDLARLAIDRSGGLLEEYRAMECADNWLMYYISERTDGLKRLSLMLCCFIDDGLVAIAKSSPQLEKLEIVHCRLSKEAIVSVGRACPQLKFFRLEETGSYMEGVTDEKAFAIADNMQGLQHLRLWANELLTSDGLHAILDHCSQLESLQIFGTDIEMDETLETKCARIRDFSLDRYSWE